MSNVVQAEHAKFTNINIVLLYYKRPRSITLSRTRPPTSTTTKMELHISTHTTTPVFRAEGNVPRLDVMVVIHSSLW